MRLVLIMGLVLAACTTINAKPAEVGMTVNQYMASCPYADPSIYYEPEYTAGQCPTKPGEYTIIEASRVIHVFGPDDMGRFLASIRCAPQDTDCLNLEVRKMRERASDQQTLLNAAIAQENRNRGAALQRFGAGLSAAGASSVGATTPHNASGPVCTKSGEYSRGFNKVCQYDCLGSPAAITVGAAELCPLTIRSPN